MNAAAKLRRLTGALGLCLALALAAACGAPTGAAAASNQVTILQDQGQILANPLGTLQQVRALGVTYLRLGVPWGSVAPDPSSTHAPRFNAADPAAYPADHWAVFDNIISIAHQLGITIDLDFMAPAPRWATGGGQPHIKGYPFGQWEPNAAEFGQFVKAVGERYSGNFDPVSRRPAPGNRADLPRVSFWSVWNEPDYGPSLAPQAMPGHPGVEYSPRMYRGLLTAAWNALGATGHGIGTDQFLIGELAPRSQLTTPDGFRDFNGLTPLVFLQNLYCENSAYRPLTGSAAALRGCPTTAAARARFVASNPALFHNSGMADHPYDEFWPPNQEHNDPYLRGYAAEVKQFTSLATISNLFSALRRLPAAWHAPANLAVWDTEYGYLTSPPHRAGEKDGHRWPSQATAGVWDNWAEYISYKNPHVKSFSQYLLKDAFKASAANDWGSFASGLLNYNGTQKADYGPFRMPVYMPVTTASSPYQGLEVWGGARPAAFAARDVPGQTPEVQVLFQPEGAPAPATIATERLSASGYFDTRIAFPSSGVLTLAYRVPSDNLLKISNQVIYSRAIKVVVH